MTILAKKIIRDKRGANLIELIIATLLFSIIVLVATRIMQSAIEGQKNALASQNIQESMRFALEMISKEVRNARKDDDQSCAVPSRTYKVYNTGTAGNTGSELYFENKNGECVRYYLSGTGQLYISRNGTALGITPDDIKITKLHFFVDDDGYNDFHAKQAKITISIEAETVMVKDIHKLPIILQTTISSRYYE